MSLVPSRHIHPASFRDPLHSSLCKFHGCTPSLQLLFRYNSNSSNSLRNHFLCRTHESVISELTNKQYPLSNSSLVLKSNKNIRWFSSGDTQTPKIQSNHSGDLWSGRWLEKWNEPKKQRCPKPPRAAANYQSSGGSILNLSNSGNAIDGDSGGGKGSTMERIVEKLKKFGYMDGGDEKESKKERVMEKGSVEDIFYVEEGILPNTRGGFSESSPLGVDKLFGNDEEVQFPWEKRSFKDEESKQSVKMRSKTSVAELTLPESELRRLRHLTLKTKKKMKIGGSGVTQAVVEAIHEGWKTSEVVRLKIEGAPALNMRRMHEILERKTGGLVIWRSGTSVSLYRGVSYEMPSLQLKKRIFKRNASLQDTASVATDESNKGPQKLSSASSVNASSDALTLERKDSTMVTEVNYEDEMDRLLGDLGPRYNDWPGGDPLPIDADMLPSVVPGFQPPFRLLPYGVRPGLGQKEATALRRLARTLPPHFALGRNRQLEGLATAIVKLWERSSIVKVALKRGVQLTSSERMAEDIKRLTGGVLLSRNKDFLVFYRGKNFLSSDVTEALLERERLAEALQDEEEHARFRAAAAVVPSAEGSVDCRSAGTLSETQDADARWGKRLDDHEVKKVLREAEHVRHADLVRKLERKLAIAERKLMKAEHALQKVEAFLSPADQQADPESITYEERFMFRKLGLRMKAFLLLGRRGVFDGTVENMHLHWKYRELVKIIAKAKSFEEVKRIALSLEAESGGVLVSVDKVSKGYAIIVFRGKDYQRPPTLRPKNLLTKRRALARSIELQRHEALLKHLSTVQKNIDRLRSEIAQMENAQEHGDKELYDRLDSAYSSEEEESEDEGEDVYLRTLVNETDDVNDNYFQSSGMNRNFTCNLQDQNDEGKYEEEDSEARFVESEEHENEATAENEPYIPFQMVLGQDQRQRKVDKISEMAQEIPADSEASVQ